MGQGFSQVFNMVGGIDDWNGLVARGTPEPLLELFAEVRKPEEFLAVAWVLEESTRIFYRQLSQTLPAAEGGELFTQLAKAEAEHKEMVCKLWEELGGKAAPVDFPLAFLPAGVPTGGVMEGGFRVQEALTWAEGKAPTEIIELAVLVEANAYDRYLDLQRQIGNQRIRAMIDAIATQEKAHLDQLVEAYAALCKPGQRREPC